MEVVNNYKIRIYMENYGQLKNNVKE